MRTLAAAAGLSLGVCVMLVARPAPESAAGLALYKIGDIVTLPVLEHLDGEAVDLEGLQVRPGPAAVVLEFWSARCPISRGYTERFERLREELSERGVALLAVQACADESVSEISAALERHGKKLDLLLDPAGRLVEQFGVQKTPHFVVLNETSQLVYSGAFDSNLVGQRDEIHSYVRSAIEAILNGRDVEIPETRTFGSPVRFPSAKLLSRS